MINEPFNEVSLDPLTNITLPQRTAWKKATSTALVNGSENTERLVSIAQATL